MRARAALAACCFAAASSVAADEVVIVPDWSQVEPAFYPLGPATPVQPVLTAADVTDGSAYFVADPFLFYRDGLWYMFFEVAVPRTRIGYAVSTDALAWRYESVVLTEPFSMSYPLVFEADGIIYMTPESASQQSVRLYRSDAFPAGWHYVTTLVSGRAFADPTVFRHGGLWWMFVGDGPSENCWLYFSSQLESGWTEHPASPIVAGNRARSRPAGRTLVLAGDRVYRLAQNSTPTYGRAVRVFQVDVLTTTGYAEHEIAESPIVQASGSGWNANGMHQIDAWWTGSDWIAATDGLGANGWSIGVYRTGGLPSDGVAIGAHAGGLRCAPNPCRNGTTLRWSPRGDAGPVRVAIYSPSGRRLLAHTLPHGAAQFVWDGTDGRGGTVAAGVYFCKLESGAASSTARVVVSR